MKNYHGIGILFFGMVIFVSACSLAIGAEIAPERPAVCPEPTPDNTAWVTTDENDDGQPDTLWNVYVDGACYGYTVIPDDYGVPM